MIWPIKLTRVLIEATNDLKGNRPSVMAIYWSASVKVMSGTHFNRVDANAFSVQISESTL